MIQSIHGTLESMRRETESRKYFFRECDCLESFVYDLILFETAHKAILVGNDEPLNDDSVSVSQSHNNDSTNKSDQPVDDHSCRRLPVTCPFQAPAGRLHSIPCVTWVTVVDMGVDYILLYRFGSEPLGISRPTGSPFPGLHPRGNAFRYPSHRRIWKLPPQL